MANYGGYNPNCGNPTIFQKCYNSKAHFFTTLKQKLPIKVGRATKIASKQVAIT